MRFLFAIYSIYFFNVFIYYHQICQANLCATCALRVCYTSKLTTFLENFRNFRYKKNPGKSRLSEVLIVFCIRLKLSFGELWCSTSSFETVFLMFPSYKPLILRAFLRFASEVPPPVNCKNGVYLLPHST